MKPARSFIIVMFAIAFGLLLPGPAFSARSGDSSAAARQPVSTADISANSVESAASPKKTHGLFDANSIFFGCAAGVTVGALMTALPPLVGWALYAGALPAVVAMIAMSGVGCSIGLFGGIILSTFHWLFSTVGAAWTAIFG
ncbi:MAG: hypothetical protein WCF85_01615 [Rhodospirillaceae bacterium]